MNWNVFKLARAPVKFIASGSEPQADSTRAELGWQPMTQDQGLARCLRERTTAGA